jgi:hypothetical protein
MRVDGFADVGWLATHLDCQADLADKIAGARAYNAASDKATRRRIGPSSC